MEEIKSWTEWESRSDLKKEKMKEADKIIDTYFDAYGGFPEVLNGAGGSTIAMIIRECMFKYHQKQILKLP